MREFAPKKSHPTDAELAAYIDGALGKAEADRVAAHLADCEDCFFVYSETLQFQLESEPPMGEVVQFPSRAPWWVAAAAAAVLVVGVGGWYTYQAALWGPRPQLAVADAAPDLRERPTQDILWKHNVYRGNGSSDPEIARQAFQVGALLVDFRLSAQAGAAEQASNVWRTIGGVVAEADYVSKELSARILSEANRIDPEQNPSDSSKSLQAVAAQLAKTEEEFRDNSPFFPEYIDFGKWTEAGRVAAKTEDSRFFEDRQNRRFLAYALKEWKPEKSDEVRRELEKIERILDQGELNSKDFKALADHFQTILNQYDFLP